MEEQRGNRTWHGVPLYLASSQVVLPSASLSGRLETEVSVRLRGFWTLLPLPREPPGSEPHLNTTLIIASMKVRLSGWGLVLSQTVL